ncbi:MAG: NnrS family protein [Pseudomonadota bacterium]
MQPKLPVFFHAPHRVMFLAGATQGIAALAWWALDLAARHGGLFQAPDWPLPAAWIHGLLMIYGFFPFFIFGFLMTAGPRWQGAQPVKRSAYISSFACMGLGWIGFYAALALPGLVVPALALVLLGWLLGLPELVRVARQPAEDRRHVVLAVSAQALGALGLAAFLGFAAGGPADLARVALGGGIWFYLLPLLVTVVHRMLPFFSGMVLPKYQGTRPFWAFYTLLACFVGHGILALAGAQQWTWLADLPAAAVALHLSWHWQIRRSFAVRMLAVLHVAFLWLGISLALFAIQSGGLLLGRGILGLAPLHALTIGFFSSLLLGMASRVTLGHSGRDLRADAWTWAIFWGLQAVALVRIAAEFVALAGPANLSLLAALGWLATYGWWYAKYAPAYLRPRPDGRPG